MRLLVESTITTWPPELVIISNGLPRQRHTETFIEDLCTKPQEHNKLISTKKLI